MWLYSIWAGLNIGVIMFNMYCVLIYLCCDYFATANVPGVCILFDLFVFHIIYLKVELC